MTVSECKARVDALCPNQYTKAEMESWCSDLDLRIYNDVFTHYHDLRDSEPLEIDNDSTELLVPDPYADIYVHWCMAQVNYYNGETVRYQNAMYQFNARYHDYVNFINRTHMPAQDVNPNIYL